MEQFTCNKSLSRKFRSESNVLTTKVNIKPFSLLSKNDLDTFVDITVLYISLTHSQRLKFILLSTITLSIY